MAARPRSQFLRNVLTLAGATTLAQLLPLAASPLLTRLYEPRHFGHAALFLAVATTLAIPATLRYSKAIVVPEDDREARALWAISLRASLGLGLGLGALAVAVLLIGPWLEGDERMAWAVFLPFSVTLFALQESMHGWLIRSKRFAPVARARVAMWVGVVSVQLAVPFLAEPGSLGLIGGLVAGQTLGFGVQSWATLPDLDQSWQKGELRAVAGRHRAFPIYSLPAGTLNVGAGQAPVVLLSVVFGSVVVGFYSLAHRVLSAPVTVAGTATGDVFRERAARAYGATGTCRPLLVRTVMTLAAMAIVPVAIVIAAGPWLFAFVFGEDWRQAGAYARLLAPLFLLRFAASPVSHVFYIANRHRDELLWQIGLALVIVATLLGGAVWGGPEQAILAFAVGYASMYGVYLVMCFRASQDPSRPRRA